MILSNDNVVLELFVSIGLLFTGFSLFSILLLFFQKRVESKLAVLYAKSLLITLGVSQLWQIYTGFNLDGSREFSHYFYVIYVFSLSSVAPLLYLYAGTFFSQQARILQKQIWHFGFPIGLSFSAGFMEFDLSTSFSLAFVSGLLYSLFLAYKLWCSRYKRHLFYLEFCLLSFIVLCAFCMCALAVSGLIPLVYIMVIQSICLSLCLLYAMHMQLNYPDLMQSITELVNKEYKSVCLTQDKALQLKSDLQQMMRQTNLYRDPALSLSSLAEHLSLKPHQLSELLNLHLHKSFSRYISELRVEDAARMMLAEPTVSILAISLSVGFKSQSTFYHAFSQKYKVTPSQYKKHHL